MPNYDINDPTDVDIMRANFDMITHREWDHYIARALEKNMSNKNINILQTAARKAGISKYLSPKVIKWVLELVDELDEDNLL
ncbi:MAG: hypothetical protein KDC80_03195 [Saprospiraceae bacterium]|nr:hypothetical protein [Saprospiraceae bacterium]